MKQETDNAIRAHLSERILCLQHWSVVINSKTFGKLTVGLILSMHLFCFVSLPVDHMFKN